MDTRLKEESNPVKRCFKRLGPGLITGASDDDPSGIGTYAVAGASLGYRILWTAWLVDVSPDGSSPVHPREDRDGEWPRHCRRSTAALSTSIAARGRPGSHVWKCSLDAKPSKAKEFYLVLGASTIGGLLIDYVGINPMDALFWTAVINGFQLRDHERARHWVGYESRRLDDNRNHVWCAASEASKESREGTAEDHTSLVCSVPTAHPKRTCGARERGVSIGPWLSYCIVSVSLVRPSACLHDPVLAAGSEPRIAERQLLDSRLQSQ